jgi:hypothetical protein
MKEEKKVDGKFTLLEWLMSGGTFQNFYRSVS